MWMRIGMLWFLTAASPSQAVEPAFDEAAAQRLQTLLQAQVPDDVRLERSPEGILLSWTTQEPVCCSESELVSHALVLNLSAEPPSPDHARVFAANAAALEALAQLQGQMEIFEERRFASSVLAFKPTTTRQRAQLKRCDALLKKLKPLPGYRFETLTITVSGDWQRRDVSEKVITLLQPLHDQPKDKTQVLYANFWRTTELQKCAPNTDYSQSHHLMLR